MKNEFEKFMNDESVSPSSKIDQIILKSMNERLNLSHKKIFTKLIFTQMFIGALTLTFCPQFNISLTNSYELFHFFHRNFGELICTGICASIFMGSGSLFANYILSLDEVNFISKNKIAYAFCISSIFITIFMMLNTEIYVLSALIWVISAALTFFVVNISALTLRKMNYNF